MAAGRASREELLAKAASSLAQTTDALRRGDAPAAAAGAAWAGEYLTALLAEPSVDDVTADARERLAALRLQVRRAMPALATLLRLNGTALAQLVAGDPPSAYHDPRCADAAPRRVALQQWEA